MCHLNLPVAKTTQRLCRVGPVCRRAPFIASVSTGGHVRAPSGPMSSSLSSPPLSSSHSSSSSSSSPSSHSSSNCSSPTAAPTSDVSHAHGRCGLFSFLEPASPCPSSRHRRLPGILGQSAPQAWNIWWVGFRQRRLFRRAGFRQHSTPSPS